VQHLTVSLAVEVFAVGFLGGGGGVLLLISLAVAGETLMEWFIKQVKKRQ